jgi:Fe-S-cluster-containing dehydrogenase component
MDGIILVRCDDCAQASCLIDCGEDAIVVAAGDVLVDTVKCGPCGKAGAAGEAPPCVVQCDKSARKTIRAGSAQEKRTKTVDRCHSRLV